MPARKAPPEGFCNASQADEILGNKMLYRYVEKGLIHQYGPETRKQKYYKISELMDVRNAENAFYESPDSTSDQASANERPPQDEQKRVVSMEFAVATPNDMDALYAMAKKLFPKTASADRRRSWLAKEPRGHFIVREKETGVVLAYLYLLPLVPDQLAPYLRGQLPSRTIEPDDIEGFTPGVPTSACVLGGIGRDPDYDRGTRTRATQLLLTSVRHELTSWGEQGIIIPKLYAFSETTDGIVMCCRLGMSQWEPPRNRWCTFQIDLEHMPSLLFADYQIALDDWKKANLPPERHPRKPSAREPLPDGWVAWFQFLKRHGLRPQSYNKDGYTHSGEYIQDRARVNDALDQVGQKTFLRDHTSDPKIHQCEVSDCPCHELLSSTAASA